MPVPAFEAFMEIFKEIPQRVIWKWEGEAHKNLPPNIMMADWLPQQDLIGKELKFYFVYALYVKKYEQVIRMRNYLYPTVECLDFKS